MDQLKYLLLFVACVASTVGRADDRTVLDTRVFRDSAHHWRNIRDDKRVIRADENQPSYQPEQVTEIAENLLMFQRANGGWPKDYDMLAILTPEQRAGILETRDREDTSFDNHNIFGQVEYLAAAYVSKSEPRWREACIRGLDFMLAAQYPEGGVPQSFPHAQGFHAAITFNDGVMIGVLRVLKDAAEGKPHFAWLDDERRQKAAAAVLRGVACTLKCQIRVQGQQTGWCQQHDRLSYEPIPARTFELASICPQDTTEIVRFLMSFPAPTPEMIAAVDAAATWLTKVQLAGLRVERVPAPKEDYLRHSAAFDVVVVADSEAGPLWARHYEIGTDRPVFAGRDGVRRYQLAEIERERRTGTPWYGQWPANFLAEEYPAWHLEISAPRAAPTR